MRRIGWLVWGLAVFVAVQTALPARAERYSLLIGINHYVVKGNDLAGCVNDVRSMKKILSLRQFPADPAHQRVLLDQRATGAAIAQGLMWLIHTAKPDDAVVIYYSGHGSFFPDALSPVRDEPDGFDAAICPADCDDQGFLIDDDIHDALSMLKARNVTVLFDCCFSGRATRAMGDPVLTNPLLLVGVRNRRRAGAVSDAKRFRADFGGQKPAPLEAGPSGASKPKRADDLLSQRIVYLGGCQPWELSDDGGPLITGNGPPYQGGLFTSLLYQTIMKLGIDTSWRNLMKEVRLRAAAMDALQEPFADGPIDNAPFTLRKGTAGKPQPPQRVSDVKPVGLWLVAGVEARPRVVKEGPQAHQLYTEVIHSLRTGGMSPYGRPQPGTGDLTMGILKRQSAGYQVWVPFYDGEEYHNFDTYDEAVEHISQGVRFAYRLRQMATLHNPASPLHVRVHVENGPSAVVPKNSVVNGTFAVTQPCSVAVLRLEPQGVVSVAQPSQRCAPGQAYPLQYTAGGMRGKELLKVIATPAPLDLARVTRAGNPLAELARQVKAAAGAWAEDQESLYIGEWRQ